MSRRLSLWAVCTSRGERIEIGFATWSGKLGNRAAVMPLVFRYLAFWGPWRGKDVKIVADTERALKAYKDVTEEATTAFVVAHPNVEELRKIFKKTPAPEITISPEDVRVVKNWQ